jgi:hypothetical protein
MQPIVLGQLELHQFLEHHRCNRWRNSRRSAKASSLQEPKAHATIEFLTIQCKQQRQQQPEPRPLAMCGVERQGSISSHGQRYSLALG